MHFKDPVKVEKLTEISVFKYNAKTGPPISKP